MEEKIDKLAEVLAAQIAPATSGKDRKRQAAVKEAIAGSLAELCAAVVDAARSDDGSGDAYADTSPTPTPGSPGEESPQ